jgi:diaminohydroxyphosphoribosylaminopyrimidine deaminase / 5-amino-6-(5-phosphoribosylamino)uracil reductase
MQRCLEIARGGMGRVAPNPMVGAVIVYDGNVISEGYHKAFGLAHAEVNAINLVKDSEILRKSTLYVNLEPCSHLGKTPPCSDLIIEKKISKVIVGTIDPNSVVAGKGIEKLKQEGIKVEYGILESDCRELNKRFFTFHEKQRPYIILKWAQTKDGFIDKIRKPGEEIGANWISNPLSRMLVHKWRAEEQAIMVGTNTVIADNPKLNVRYWSGTSPIRLVIDEKLRIPAIANIYDNSSQTIIYNRKKSGLEEKTEFVNLNSSESNLNEILKDLSRRNIISLLVEGGRELLESFIAEKLWDEARVFIGDKTFRAGLVAPKLTIKYKTDFLLDDQIQFYYNS